MSTADTRRYNDPPLTWTNENPRKAGWYSRRSSSLGGRPGGHCRLNVWVARNGLVYLSLSNRTTDTLQTAGDGNVPAG
jgi:hypothetical protein